MSADATQLSIAALEDLAALDDADLARALDEARATQAVTALASPSRSEQRRAAEALAVLAKREPTLSSALERALSAPAQRLRWGAAFTLGRAIAAPPAALWPAVREAMALDDGDQRWAAAELACRLARLHPGVRDDLFAALRDASATLRKMALYCMRELGGTGTRAAALALLGDSDPGTRLAAIAVLAQPDAPPDERARDAAALCERVARDAEDGVRRAAAAALGKLGESSAAVLDVLDRAAADADRSLARAARDAAARLRRGGAPN